jgi:L-ascorbate metabolism protein UlaG (beta-lactamase superfamily)
MRLTWYGTAGFRIETGRRVFLIDPYLGRITAACPALPIGPRDVTQASEIYLSHGHFDHAADVPQIARQTGATVYCSAKVAQALRRQGVDGAQIVVARDGDAFDFNAYRARCYDSTHVRFDLSLIAATLYRSLPTLLPCLWRLRGLHRWPRGQVLTWRFTLAAERDRVVQHLGSAGCTEYELARLEKLDAPDVLMVPLQGHTHICRIAARIVARLRPRVVIPHHHDDFFPPLSQMVDIAPFVAAVSALPAPVEAIELPLCEPVEV